MVDDIDTAEDLEHRFNTVIRKDENEPLAIRRSMSEFVVATIGMERKGEMTK